MSKVGTRLGRYEITRAIGAGGMGQVFRAHDPLLGRDVAIKVLPENIAEDPDRVRRLEQEARAIAALNHPHICQIYDVVHQPTDASTGAGATFLVLELVDGAPLQGALPPQEVVRLGIQIADAIGAAHQKGVLHRDLKPANIMVSANGDVKVLDFGLAKMMTDDVDVTRTTDGLVVGTAAYMSPEQAECKPLDARSDVFSFGAVLYEILSGLPAFPGDTVARVLTAVLRDDPRPVNAPAALQHIIRRCLAKQPSQRFDTMREVKTALEAMSAGPREVGPSIAVLPFENMSAEKANEYFSDGLAEEILNLLARVRGLKVIARTSSFAFKGKHQDVRQIAQALGVTNILEGSVRKAGGRIRVTAQLISGADGGHVWSERYDRELADVFAVQDEIAAAIVHALQGKFLGTARAPRAHTTDLAAYENYLQALHESQKWTPDSLARARGHLERAIALDPNFAAAHAELAHVFHRFIIYGLMPAREALAHVRLEATRALARNSSLPEGHAMLGAVAAMFDFDWQEAEDQFKVALAQESAPALVHRYYAHYCLLPLGRALESIEHHDVVVSEDPLNLTARSERALALQAAGRPAEAEAELRRIMELDETFWFPYFILGQAHALQGRNDEALRLIEQAHRAAPWFLPVIAVLAVVLERVGEAERSAALAQRLRPDGGYIDPIGPATFHLLRGEFDAAADWTEKAIDERQPAVFFFLHVAAEALRTSPRWPSLARKMHLPS